MPPESWWTWRILRSVVLGRYSFRSSTPVDGGLRPLRDPGAPELDEDNDDGQE
ncbi:hypothetical protein AB0G77_28325 [Streptomyces hygroscopicus]|uniref:hypothetical protein n=1 Tax=Streptomyces hygroscopicus TaxID=1912 RepID=UPI0034105E80